MTMSNSDPDDCGAAAAGVGDVEEVGIESKRDMISDAALR